MRLQLFILAYNLGDFLRRLCLPKAINDWSLCSVFPTYVGMARVTQKGVFVVFLIAYLTEWFTEQEAACVGIIGGSDGPPTVFVTVELARQLLGPITLVAYSYMALVPILQPPIIRLLTTKKERAIYMKPQVREVPRLELILFPILVFLAAALLVPRSAPLIGMLMFGNLLRVNGVTDIGWLKLLQEFLPHSALQQPLHSTQGLLLHIPPPVLLVPLDLPPQIL